MNIAIKVETIITSAGFTHTLYELKPLFTPVKRPFPSSYLEGNLIKYVFTERDKEGLYALYVADKEEISRYLDNHKVDSFGGNAWGLPEESWRNPLETEQGLFNWLGYIIFSEPSKPSHYLDDILL